MAYLPPKYSQRVKPPPPPIRVPTTPSGSRPGTPTGSAGFSPEQLLYELPPSSSLRSPPPLPTSNRSLARSRSPPSANGRRTSFGAVLQTRSLDSQEILSQAPSPKRHAASLGGNEPKQVDLDVFTEACRRWRAPICGKMLPAIIYSYLIGIMNKTNMQESKYPMHSRM